MSILKKVQTILLSLLMVVTCISFNTGRAIFADTDVVSLSVDSTTLKVGETTDVTASLVGDAFTTKGDAGVNVAITSGSEYATLKDGTLTAVNPGTVTVTATLTGTECSDENTGGYKLADGYVIAEVSKTVTIEEAAAQVIPEKYTLTGSSNYGDVGGVTFIVDGSEVTETVEGTTVKATAVALEGQKVTLSSEDVEINEDGTFIMPAKAVSVVANYDSEEEMILTGSLGNSSGVTMYYDANASTSATARSNGAVFNDMTKALSFASSGDTVVLRSDISGISVYVVNDGVTIDLNGHYIETHASPQVYDGGGAIKCLGDFNLVDNSDLTSVHYFKTHYGDNLLWDLIDSTVTAEQKANAITYDKLNTCPSSESGSEYGDAIVKVYGGVFAGHIIRNADNVSNNVCLKNVSIIGANGFNGNSSIIDVSNGTLTMENSKILGCSVLYNPTIKLNNARFTMTDSVTIRYNWYFMIKLDSGSVLDFNGGDYQYNTNISTPIVVNANSTLNINGGEIKNNYFGKCVDIVDNGKVNMTSGTIRDCGCGVYMEAPSTNTSYTAAFTMTGGTITENKCGVSVNSPKNKVVLGGTANITGNNEDTYQSFTVNRGNLQLNSANNQNTVYLSTAVKPTTMQVGVGFSSDKGTFVSEGATASDTQYFSSDNDSYYVKSVDNTLLLDNQWSVKLYGVTSQPTTIKVGDGLTVDLPTPTSKDKEFGGWYADSTYTTEYVATTPVTKDINLFAKWNDHKYVYYSNNVELTGLKTSDALQKGIKVIGEDDSYVVYCSNCHMVYFCDDSTEADTVYANWTTDYGSYSEDETQGTHSKCATNDCVKKATLAEFNSELANANYAVGSAAGRAELWGSVTLSSSGDINDPRTYETLTINCSGGTISCIGTDNIYYYWRRENGYISNQGSKSNTYQIKRQDVGHNIYGSIHPGLISNVQINNPHSYYADLSTSSTIAVKDKLVTSPGSGTEADPWVVSDKYELIAAVETGGYIKLASDIDYGILTNEYYIDLMNDGRPGITDNPLIYVYKDTTLDLNGHTVKYHGENTNGYNYSTNVLLFDIQKRATLTLTGSGALDGGEAEGDSDNLGGIVALCRGDLVVKPDEGKYIVLIAGYSDVMSAGYIDDDNNLVKSKFTAYPGTALGVMWASSSSTWGNVIHNYYGTMTCDLKEGSLYETIDSSYYDTDVYCLVETDFTYRQGEGLIVDTWGDGKHSYDGNYSIIAKATMICEVNGGEHALISKGMTAAKVDGIIEYPIVLIADASYSSSITENYTFNGDYTLSVSDSISAGTYNCPVEISGYISGGIFNNTVEAFYDKSISGGAFKYQPKDKTLANGYTTLYDGTYYHVVLSSNVENDKLTTGKYDFNTNGLEADGYDTVADTEYFVAPSIYLDSDTHIIAGVYSIIPEGLAEGYAYGQVSDGYIVGQNITVDSNKNLTSGTYRTDPTAYIDANRYSVSHEGDIYTIIDNPEYSPVKLTSKATGDVTKYQTIEEALTASGDGDTITLYTTFNYANEFTGSAPYYCIEVPENKNVNIDLNGYEVNYTGRFGQTYLFHVPSTSTVTLEGKGTMNNTQNYYCGLFGADGKVIIEPGKDGDLNFNVDYYGHIYRTDNVKGTNAVIHGGTYSQDVTSLVDTNEYSVNKIQADSQGYTYKYVVLPGYLVTFSTGYEGGYVTTYQTVEPGGKAVKPDDPEPSESYSYYGFNGWYYNGSLYDFDTVLTGSITLTAKWESLSTVAQIYRDGEFYKTYYKINKALEDLQDNDVLVLYSQKLDEPLILDQNITYTINLSGNYSNYSRGYDYGESDSFVSYSGTESTAPEAVIEIKSGNVTIEGKGSIVGSNTIDGTTTYIPCFKVDEGASLSIKEGYYYNWNIPEEYLADGYKAQIGSNTNYNASPSDSNWYTPADQHIAQVVRNRTTIGTYMSFADAIAVAQDGDIIYAMNHAANSWSSYSMTVSEPIIVDKNVTFYLNNVNITLKADEDIQNAFVVKDGKTVTISGYGGLVASGYNNLFKVEDDSTLRVAGSYSGCIVNNASGKIFNVSDSGTVLLSGGYYDQEPLDEYIVDGYMKVYQGNLWYVVPIVARNITTGADYPDLASAINAATDGQTVQVRSEASFYDVITIDKNITLDLNGNQVSAITQSTGGYYDNNARQYVYTYRYAYFDVVNGGTLNITDSADGGTLDTQTQMQSGNAKLFAVAEDGTLNISAGIFTFTDQYKQWGNTTTVTIGLFDGTPAGTVSITGGTYPVDPSNTENYGKNLVADGYASTANGTSPETWTVDSSAPGYRITYNLNYEGSASTKSAKTETIIFPANPTRTGYKFGGWYTEASCINKAVAGTSISQAITLYAKWEMLPAITVDNATGVATIHKNDARVLEKVYVYKAKDAASVKANFASNPDYYVNYTKLTTEGTNVFSRVNSESTPINDLDTVQLKEEGTYIIRLKYTDASGKAGQYTSNLLEVNNENVSATIAYLSIDDKTLNVTLQDGRPISKIELYQNDSNGNKVLVTSNANKTSINAPYNGSYLVKVTDFHNLVYNLNCCIDLASLPEMMFKDDLTGLINKITAVAGTSDAEGLIVVNDSKVVLPGATSDNELTVSQTAKDTLLTAVSAAQGVANSDTSTQKEITDAYNTLSNAFDVYLSQIQVNLLSVTKSVNGYEVKVKSGSNYVVESVLVKGTNNKTDDKSFGVFTEDYTDFTSEGSSQSIAAGKSTIRLVNDTNGVYSVRYKVKLNLKGANDVVIADNEFRASSYVVLGDDNTAQQAYSYKALYDLAVRGMNMYRLIIKSNLESKSYAETLKTALTNAGLAPENITDTSTTITTVTGLSNASTVSNINLAYAIRDALSECPKLSDYSSATVYKTYVLKTADKAVPSFDDAVVTKDNLSTLTLGTNNLLAFDYKDSDGNKASGDKVNDAYLNVDASKGEKVVIAVNNNSHTRVAFGDFSSSNTWAQFSSVPYSTYYDQVVVYEPKWNGTYTVRVKYFDNTYQYLHFTVTGASEPITITANTTDNTFGLAVNDNWEISKIQYVYSGINDTNYWDVYDKTKDEGIPSSVKALGVGEHTFVVTAIYNNNGTKTSGTYYVHASMDSSSMNPVTVEQDGKVGIYSNSSNTLSVAYQVLNDGAKAWSDGVGWSDIISTSNITYTVKSGAIDVESVSKLLQFAFAIIDGNYNLEVKLSKTA